MKRFIKLFIIYLLILGVVILALVTSGIYRPQTKTKIYVLADMKLKDIVMLGDGGLQTYSADSYVEISGLNVFIQDIKISGSDILNSEKKIYYADTNPFSSYSENKTITTAGDTVQIERFVYNLRIDLTDQAGVTFSLADIEIDYIDYISDFLIVATLVLIGYLLLFLLIRMRFSFQEMKGSSKSKFQQDLIKYMPLVKNLISKDIKIKYRRSILGILWSILNPLLMMIILTIVFSNIFRIQVENFPIYYLSGITLWTLFTEGTTGAMTSISSVSQLISKVYIPKYIFPLEKVAFSLVNFMFSIVAVLIVTLALKFPLSWTAFLIIIPVIYVLVFSIGIGLVLSTVSIFFKDVVHLYGVLTMAWMYLTPILYPMEIVSAQVKAVINLNPMYHYVSYFRDLYMYNTIPDLKANLICILFSFVSLAIGIVIFRKHQDRLILHL